MAGVGGGIVPPRSASATGHAGGPGGGGSSGGIFGLVPQLMVRAQVAGGGKGVASIEHYKLSAAQLELQEIRKASTVESLPRWDRLPSHCLAGSSHV